MKAKKDDDKASAGMVLGMAIGMSIGITLRKLSRRSCFAVDLA